MNPDDLLAIAHDLVRREPARPKQASLKRAVSTAYYALFHAVAYECVDQTIGWNFRSDRYWDTLSTLYRAVDHGAAKRIINNVRGDPRSSAELKGLARNFVDLQAGRIQADYDPRPSFLRADASQFVAQADDAVRELRALPKDVKRDLAVQILSKQR